MSLRTLHTLLSVSAVALLVSSCGGGGGGGGASGGSTAPPPTYTLSGNITLPGTAAVDSDTNDPDQVGWASNDTDASAQILTSPVQLVGSLNVATKGPAGKTYTAGDLRDIFKVSLIAGQVIELVFAGNTTDNDIDLLLFDVSASTSAVPVGASSSTTSTRECIVVTRTGDYYVMPWIQKGAALYSLTISAVGEGGSCSNTASGSALFGAGTLIAKEKPLLDMGITGGYAPFSAYDTGNFPKLLSVPASSPLAAFGVASNATASASGGRDTDINAALATLRYAKDLMSTGKYAYVEPDFYLHAASYAPDDPRYPDQRWHYEMINLPSAMDRIDGLVLTNPRRPVVAVVDAGFATNHPDMAGQLVDSYTFIGGSATPGADGPQVGCGGPGSFCYHGFFVAGIVAALTNNGEFGAGIAPMAQIMPIQTTYLTHEAVQGMLYAAGLPNISGALPSRKADVINLSFGGAGGCPAAFSDVIAQVRAQNVMVVASSGNSTSGSRPVAQPANCPGVISVGALDINKTRTSYTGHGAELSLIAPGGGATSRADVVWSISGSTASPFIAGTGTSFSAPHVVGVLALMRYIYPDLTVAQVDTLLASGRLTDDLGASGRDDEYGQGVINARKAVDEAISLAAGSSLPGVVVATPASLSLGSSLSSTTLRLSGTAASGEAVVSIVSSHAAVSITAGSSVSSTTRLGDYTVSVDRSALPVGFSYPVLTVTTTSRTFTVPITVVKLAAGASTAANLGGVWVQVSNASTGSLIARKRFNVSAGSYAWSLSGIPAGSVRIIASTDLNNDRSFCEQGEACGNHPESGSLYQVNGNASGLDFSIAPMQNSP